MYGFGQGQGHGKLNGVDLRRRQGRAQPAAHGTPGKVPGCSSHGYVQVEALEVESFYEGAGRAVQGDRQVPRVQSGRHVQIWRLAEPHTVCFKL